MDTCEYTVMHSLPSLQIHEIKEKKKKAGWGEREGLGSETEGFQKAEGACIMEEVEE